MFSLKVIALFEDVEETDEVSLMSLDKSPPVVDHGPFQWAS